MNGDNVTYFDSFGIKHNLKEIEKFIGNRNIKTNIYRIQANDSVMGGYFCLGFIDFILKSESLLHYINLFPPNEYIKNDKIISFSIWVFFHYHSRIMGLQGKGEGISLPPHYHFHPLHRHLDISRAITVKSSPLHIASIRT